MIFSRNVSAAALGVLAAWLTGSGVAVSANDGTADDAKVSIHGVAKTYNDSPFEYRLRSVRKTGAYCVYRLEYPSPVLSDHEKNNTIPADYYLPNGIEPGAAPRPAVVCLHILNGNFELVNMLCSSLAGRAAGTVYQLPAVPRIATAGRRRRSPHGRPSGFAPRGRHKKDRRGRDQLGRAGERHGRGQ